MRSPQSGLDGEVAEHRLHGGRAVGGAAAGDEEGSAGIGRGHGEAQVVVAAKLFERACRDWDEAGLAEL